MALRRVTSFKNPHVKLVLGLREKRNRTRHGLFLIEGQRELQRAAEAGRTVDLVLVAESRASDPVTNSILVRLQGHCDPEILSVTDSVMERVCVRGVDAAVIAAAPSYSLDLSHLSVQSDALFLVAMGIEKPGNLGTILRSADAAGANGVILCDELTDIFNPNVVRASLGTLFSVPVARTTFAELLQWRSSNGIFLAAASPESATPYTQADYTKSVGLIVGNEAQGLSKDWLDSVDVVVSLPQLGQADSLNAAMASTLMLFEARRQRDQKRTKH